MKILGLDLGSKTLGIASSDMLQMVASKMTTLRFETNDFESALNQLNELIDWKLYECIVLGLPKNMNGSLGQQAQDTMRFKDMLIESTGKDVVLWDERLTSRMAHSVMISADLSRKKRKKKVDYIAATIILQSYLDSRK
jgi:putative Holliday junction resolvase